MAENFQTLLLPPIAISEYLYNLHKVQSYFRIFLNIGFFEFYETLEF